MFIGSSQLSFYYVRLVQAYDHIKSEHQKASSWNNKSEMSTVFPFLLGIIHVHTSVNPPQ